MKRSSWENGLRETLEVLAEKHGVPGTSLAVYHGGETFESATGVLNLKTGVEATPDTLFQIGSITKVYTATLVMLLVQEGKLRLDEPVRAYLPDFRLEDEEAAASITVRQLLAHTSGMEGDQFEDFGRGDDCLERFVEACAGLPQLHRPGQLFSYCNAGYVIAGRIVEVLTGKTWDAALKEMLLDPAGLKESVTLPEDALLHRAAVGHLPDPEGPVDGTPILAPQWMPPRSIGPAGLVTATARDAVSFVRLHLAGGLSVDGERVLSEEIVAEMQQPQINIVPNALTGLDAWGLGWELYDWGGRRVIGHDGNTIGQNAFMRAFPSEDLVVVLLTNGPGASEVFEGLFPELFAPFGMEPAKDPEPLEAGSLELEPSRFVGKYTRMGIELGVSEGDGGLVMNSAQSGPLSDLAQELENEPMRPAGATTFLVRLPGSEKSYPATFVDIDRSNWLYLGARAHRRSDA